MISNVKPSLFSLRLDMKTALLTFLITLLFSTDPIFAKSPVTETMIQCLGREENLLHHHRFNGPLYSLNQKLLNALIVASDLKFKESYIKKICHSSEFSPSVNLLRHLLIEGKEIYQVDEKMPGLQAQKYQVIELFLSEIPPLFFQYLADLQYLLPTPDCLQKQLPFLTKFLFEYQYGERETEWSEQLMEKKRLDKIFQSLRKFDNLIKVCQQQVTPKKTP